MNIVRIRNLEIGTGVPKICVPIVGKTADEIIQAAKEIRKYPIDLVEWRADWYEKLSDAENLRQMLLDLRAGLGELPLLFTIRTKDEGGEAVVSASEYQKLNLVAAESDCADLIDVEVFKKEICPEQLVETLHEAGVKIVGSNHDFDKTPKKEELIRRLCHMQDCGMDILKIAVMPHDNKDVLELLGATEEMVREYACQPVVTMSMGGTGLISRICGETFGSAITFGAIGKVSAPGQLEAVKLREMLEIIHQNR